MNSDTIVKEKSVIAAIICILPMNLLVTYGWVSSSGYWLLASVITVFYTVGSISRNFDAEMSSLIFIFILWASFPMVFKILKGISMRRRLPYTWLFCTKLSQPLYLIYGASKSSGIFSF